MKVKECSSLTQNCIGFTDEHFQKSKMPGSQPNSYGYHSKDGVLFCGSGSDKPCVGEFEAGDTEGAGINYATQEIFFTINGELLPGKNTVDVESQRLYATIALYCESKVELNFGKKKFVFDVEVMEVQVRRQTRL